MIETTEVTTRAERRQVAAAWRAIPFPRRRDVVRAAARGIPADDVEAATVARELARMNLSPWGPRWFQQPRVHRRIPWLLLALAGALVAESVQFLRLHGGVMVVGWVSLVLALVAALYAALFLAVIRDYQRLLTLEVAD